MLRAHVPQPAKLARRADRGEPAERARSLASSLPRCWSEGRGSAELPLKPVVRVTPGRQQPPWPQGLRHFFAPVRAPDGFAVQWRRATWQRFRPHATGWQAQPSRLAPAQPALAQAKTSRLQVRQQARLHVPEFRLPMPSWISPWTWRAGPHHPIRCHATRQQTLRQALLQRAALL